MKRLMLVAVAVLAVGCGVVGPEGPQGRTGPRGPGGLLTGSAYRSCNQTFAGVYYGEYTMTRDESGATFVSCAISDPARTFSNVEIWRAGTNGATNGACAVVYDLESSTLNGGFWAFQTVGGVTSARYNDVSSPSNGVTYAFDAASCSTQ